MLNDIKPANVEATVRKLVSFGTRATGSSQTDPNRGIGAARDWIKGEFDKIAATSGGRMTVALTPTSSSRPRGSRCRPPITNVVATLKGTQPIRGPHLCRLGPLRLDVHLRRPTPSATRPAPTTTPRARPSDRAGAGDVEAQVRRDDRLYGRPGRGAGPLRLRHISPKQAMAAKMDIEGMFTNDIVGGVAPQQRHQPDRTRCAFSPRACRRTRPRRRPRRAGQRGRRERLERRGSSRAISRRSPRTVSGQLRVWIIYRRDRYRRGGDHIPFLEHGFTAVRFTEPDEDYTHQHQNVRVGERRPLRRPAGVRRLRLHRPMSRRGSTRSRWPPGRGRPASRRTSGIVTARLTNDTELKWDANTDPDLAGYEIVWRDTDVAALDAHDPGRQCHDLHVKGMSKDNFFFGVRAVDKDGNRSPVRFPGG